MKTKNNRKGYALLTVMFIIAILGMLVGVLTKIGEQRLFDARRQTNKIKALAYAEGGVDYAYSILSSDFSKSSDESAFSLSSTEGSSLSSSLSSVENDYDDGSFALTLTSISNRYVIVNSVGKCGSVSSEAEVVVEDLYAGSGTSEETDYSDMEGFNYAILCGGTFDFSGCGSISSTSTDGLAKFHSNGAMDVTGNTDPVINLSSSTSIDLSNNIIVGGSATAPSVTTKNKTTVTGGIYTPKTVPTVEIPDIDLTPYYQQALKNNEVHGGGTWTTDLNPVGGIMWVEGDFHISAHATINGSVIATGDINLSGQIDINPTTYAFSVASRDGDIQVTSSGTITGLMYAKTGGLRHTANGEIVGQVIINGSIKKAGNSDIITGYCQNIPTPPSSTVTPTQCLPVISAWQK
ncbi:hypothetical protein [Pontiella sp.]|uniref:hypothetical protein n=1 Tax=Pontiella sp. TaxID=2837462 RepID=UPI003565F48E